MSPLSLSYASMCVYVWVHLHVHKSTLSLPLILYNVPLGIAAVISLLLLFASSPLSDVAVVVHVLSSQSPMP